MSLWDKFKNIISKSDTESKTIIDDPLLEALIRGENITKDKALSIPAISSAVDKISNIIAMLPIYLYRETIENETSKINKINDDARVFLLNDETGDTLDSFQLKKALVQDYLLDKGGFAYINKQYNQIISLNYTDASQISTSSNNDPIFKKGLYSVYGKNYELYQFLSILRQTKDGIKGKSLITEIQKALETAYTNLLFELRLVKKGGAKKGFLQAKNNLSDEAMEKLRVKWNELYNNPNENTMVLGNGLSFQDASNSSEELQFNERKQTLNQEINNIFHISDDYNKTIKEAVMPIIKAFETALNKSLLLENEKKEYYFAFDTKEIMKGSIKERYEAYQIAKQSGWITGNEIRYMEDLNPLDGLDVVSFSLANVLYDPVTKKYYVPNTGQTLTIPQPDENLEGGETTDE